MSYAIRGRNRCAILEEDFSFTFNGSELNSTKIFESGADICCGEPTVKRSRQEEINVP